MNGCYLSCTYITSVVAVVCMCGCDLTEVVCVVFVVGLCAGGPRKQLQFQLPTRGASGQIL